MATSVSIDRRALRSATSSPGLDTKAAWHAVRTRDPSSDGAFVYGVVTTGVFCRPSCRSRPAKRENVRFFSSGDAAEHAGFRACLRCTPTSAALRGTEALAERVKTLIDERLARDSEARLTLQHLAGELGVSPFHLQRSFRRVTGVSPAEYVRAWRMQRLKGSLKTSRTVSAATFDAGFGSVSRAYQVGKSQLGMTLADYKRGGEGIRIRFTTRRTDLGTLLVAATDHGVCAVSLGSTEAEVEAGLAAEFPNATRVRVTHELDDWVVPLLRYVEDGKTALHVPLELVGSPFQLAVWQELARTPRGRTRSYGDVAAALGRPSAARAVARACATNRIALLVPCHRVVRGDASLGGYRWGSARKEALLARESRRGLRAGSR
jgi:AraC family transcriptional regulator of adaptative response/methylated-DNA-[protein]-cysteine methyltransferase